MRTITKFGILAVMIFTAIGIVNAMTGDIQFTEQINRPGNFIYTDGTPTNPTVMSGWNGWSHSMSATAGTFDSISQFKTLDVPCNAAPEEKSHEAITLNFYKNGQTVDPLVGETIDSDITVGAVGTSTIPTFSTTGNIPQAAVDERYDIMHYTMGGSAGIYDNTGTLTSNDGSRQVFSQIMSSQDDFIHAQGFDSAGNVYAVPTSYTDVVIPGTPGTDETQAYRQFNWIDSRGWAPTVGDLNGEWKITNQINYQMYNIPFNVGK